MDPKISEIRKSYTLSSLEIEDAGSDPVLFFKNGLRKPFSRKCWKSMR
ncbi:hypothetical protein LEP1GSC116_3749 [Leptospira interrogans serovar Icterohaemorrhagiae str. Verdun HP]|uniref:Uncharacterized protein n=1 Tax=Leptospira interrogans serovar Icterohaemorrhagiae str. Verdun HP TaxID=1049910 RepID=M6R3Q0_LEPIR|nr:hypothetical protein LEP1GSC116_3749 [Leptospira interrogans serovar Icterohaemorrhagiae str. Verdun HP]